METQHRDSSQRPYLLSHQPTADLVSDEATRPLTSQLLVHPVPHRHRCLLLSHDPSVPQVQPFPEILPPLTLFPGNASTGGPIPLRILPLGDSLTKGYGSSDDNGYRLFLHNLLEEAGVSISCARVLLAAELTNVEATPWSSWAANQMASTIFIALMTAGAVQRSMRSLAMLPCTEDFARTPT